MILVFLCTVGTSLLLNLYSTVVINEQHQDQLVEITPADTLVVELPNQPGTGYYWTWVQADAVGEKIRLLGEEAMASDHLPGGEARQQFQFEPQGPGSVTLTFHLERSWEETVLRKYQVRLRIR